MRSPTRRITAAAQAQLPKRRSHETAPSGEEVEASVEDHDAAPPEGKLHRQVGGDDDTPTQDAPPTAYPGDREEG